MKTNAPTLFVSVAAAGIALGAPAPKERADTAFNALFDEGGFAYMQCAFAQHGETRYAFTRKADDAALATNKNTRLKNLNAPFDADTPLHVASVTKVVTAVLLVQLAEEGRLSLRDPVKRHVPLFPDDKVLILHLMTHTSGWRNKTGHSREPKQAEKFYTTLFKEAEIEERFQYMSQGYDILAEIVERVSGADDVADVAAARIFEPLGMTESTLNGEGFGAALADGTAALPYAFERKGREMDVWPMYGDEQSLWWLTVVGPAGSVCCTPTDLIKWAVFHLGDGKVGDRQLISEKQMNFLHRGVTITSQNADKTNLYGHCWFIEQTRKGRLYFHTGTTWGMTTICAFIPEMDFAMTIQVNSEAPSEARHAILRRAIDLFLGYEDYDYVDIHTLV